MIRIRQVDVKIGGNEEEIIKKCAKKLRTNKENIKNYKIVKKSIDAREKENICFIYEIDVNVQNEAEILKKNRSKDVLKAPTENYKFNVTGNKKIANRPVIIGSGPAGLFCAYMLAKHGYKPIILERGEKIEDRVKSVEKFWNEGILNPNSNVQFGEGAGYAGGIMSAAMDGIKVAENIAKEYIF